MLSCKRCSVLLSVIFCTTLLSRVAAGQSSDSGFGGGFGCSPLRLAIRDRGGRPVAGASVWLNGNLLAVSDSSGWVEIQTRLPADQPVSIRV